MSQPLEIAVNQEDCIGCSACVDEAPETFAMNDENKAVVKTPPNDEQDFILAAAKACPIDVITVTDPVAGTQLYPQG